MPIKKDQKNSDAVTITYLFILGYIGLQVINIIDLSIKGTLTISVFEDKAMTQVAPFLLGYFISLIYVSKTHTKK